MCQFRQNIRFPDPEGHKHPSSGPVSRPWIGSAVLFKTNQRFQVNYLTKVFSTSAAAFGFASVSLLAQNENHAPGDLVLCFQKEGGSNTVYANLGNAATLFRKAAAGPQDGDNLVRFLDISAQLEEAFGEDWANDTGLYAGAAAVWGTSNTNAITLQNGDPHRTLYITRSRDGVGTIGEPNSTGWDLSLAGNSAMTTASSGILSQNLVLETQFSTAVAVAAVGISQIDDQNPFTAPGIQGPAMSGSLDGGIQQPGSAQSFGTMGPAGTVEFALDLYRVLAINTAPSQVGGDVRQGSFEGTLTVDASGMVSFIVQETAPAPEIDMKLGDTSITDGDFTQDYGTVSTSSEGLAQTFTIFNNGNAPLTGIAVSKSGDHAADFVVSSPGTTTIAAGSSASFTVTFKPSAAGVRNARISVASNDADESPFRIDVTGTGVVLKPEIVVTTALGAELKDGEAKLAFANVNVGRTSSSQILIVKNTGNSPLTGIRVTKGGAEPGDFVVSGPALPTLAAGASTTISVAFKPKAGGTRKAVLLIRSNDANEDPFNIAVSGKGVVLAPDIDIRNPAGTSLTDGQGSTAMGSAKVGVAKDALVFTIRNRGNANLTSLDFSKTGENPGDFVIGKPKKTTVAAGSSITFTVTFKPTKKGDRSAEIRVRSNDPNENPFNLVVKGKGLAP